MLFHRPESSPPPFAAQGAAPSAGTKLPAAAGEEGAAPEALTPGTPAPLSPPSAPLSARTPSPRTPAPGAPSSEAAGLAVEPRGFDPHGLEPRGLDTFACPRCKEENAVYEDSCRRCGFSFAGTPAFGRGGLEEDRGRSPPGAMSSPARARSPAPAAAGAEARSLLGSVINEKYRVVSVLGEGGFGVVYKVELILFERGGTFALKLLHPALSRDAAFRRRFLREASLALSLIHESAIQIREFGQTADGQLFFTMDYCQGESLKRIIAREGFLNVNRAVSITRQILEVIRHAHARRVLHRDIKPENIFIEQGERGLDRVKLGDFGLAKSLDSRGSGERPGPTHGTDNLSRGAILGTPRYMSPEQAMGRDDLDERSDLYSVGVVLHEMLYGVTPGQGDSSEPLVPLEAPRRNAGHQVPDAVWQVVRSSLAAQREARFPDAQAFLHALDGLPAYETGYVALSTEPPPRTRPGLRLAAAALVLALGVLAGIFGSLGWERMRGAAGKETERAVVQSGQGEIEATGASSPLGIPPSLLGFDPPLSSPDDIRAYAPYRVGEVRRFIGYGRDLQPARELSYVIEAEPEPGVLRVRVVPGDRTFQWIISPQDNALYQEFLLPSLATGALTEVTRRTLLELRRPNALADRAASQFIRVHPDPVDLDLPPQHPRVRRFARCLVVELREEGRVHYHYYLRYLGLVGVEVYEGTPSPPPGSSDPRGLVYARYLAERSWAPVGGASTLQKPTAPGVPDLPTLVEPSPRH